MIHESHVELFIAIVSAHKGLARAISAADMAGRLGFEPGRNGERQVRMIKQAVVERGHLIGSSCGKISGYFVPESDREIELTLSQYKSRIRSLARLVRQTEGAAGFTKFVGELALEFEGEGQTI